MQTTCVTWGSVHTPEADWINMRKFMQVFLFIMGFLLLLGVQGGIETAEDIIDWFWVATVFVGGACAVLVAVRIDAFTK